MIPQQLINIAREAKHKNEANSNLALAPISIVLTGVVFLTADCFVTLLAAIVRDSWPVVAHASLRNLSSEISDILERQSVNYA